MTCAWIGCDRAPRSRGLCAKHYDKTLRAGRREKRPVDRRTT